jgi:hypothetical protein
MAPMPAHLWRQDSLVLLAVLVVAKGETAFLTQPVGQAPMIIMAVVTAVVSEDAREMIPLSSPRLPVVVALAEALVLLALTVPQAQVMVAPPQVQAELLQEFMDSQTLGTLPLLEVPVVVLVAMVSLVVLPKVLAVLAVVAVVRFVLSLEGI